MEQNEEQSEAMMNDLLTNVEQNFREALEGNLPPCRSNQELADAIVNAHMIGFTSALGLWNKVLQDGRE